MPVVPFRPRPITLPLPAHWVLGASQGRVSLLLSKRAVLGNMVLLLALLAAATASLGMGSVKLTPTEVWLALLGEGSPTHQLVVKELRLLRVLAGIGTGAAFALSGCLMQTQIGRAARR